MAKADSDLSRRFPATGLPWVLAILGFVLYAFTLNHWIAAESLRTISRLQEITGQVEYTSPVFFVVTYPLRWLSAAHIPLAANGFTAVCAMLVLAQLGRCIALLAHDRTSMERQRNPHRHGLLAVPLAWIPPVVATLAFGMQLTFWEHAVSATGEMFDLLLFALMVRCLLEYRLRKNDFWLVLCALINGLAVANNWAMVGYLPLFLIVIFWFKGGFGIFSSAFLAQLLGGRLPQFDFKFFWRAVRWWWIGFSFFMLLPIVSSFSTRAHLPFWQCLKLEIRVYLIKLELLPLIAIILLSLTSLIPLVFVGIRWGRLVRHETPVIAVWISASAFHLINLFFLLSGLWVMLDSPLSARHLQNLFPCLPLYFLTTLVISYSIGYFLLVWRNRYETSRRYKTPFWRNRQFGAFVGLAIVTVIAVTLLLAKNLPVILRKQEGAMLTAYFTELQRELPEGSAVVFSYDPSPLLLLEESLIRYHHENKYVLVDTSLLGTHPEYLGFLNRKYPAFQINSYLPSPKADPREAPVLMQWLHAIARNHELYWLHPVAGFIAEDFESHQQGLVYPLKPYASRNAAATPMSANDFSRNEKFWANFRAYNYTNLIQRTALPSGRFAPAEPDSSAFVLSGYYSLALDNWGVELQRRGDFKGAGSCFELAKNLSRENISAQINFDCNERLRAYEPIPTEPKNEFAERAAKIDSWGTTLRLYGPIDEPNACYKLGVIFRESGMRRQSIEQFQRVRALAPDYLDGALRLGDAYLQSGRPNDALEQADAALAVDPRSRSALLLRGMALIELKEFPAALPTLNKLVNQDPQNSQAHLARGYSYLQLRQYTLANVDYSIVVHNEPDNFAGYYGLAAVAYQRQQVTNVIGYGQLYLAKAPTDAPDRAQIETWITEARKKK